MDENTKEKKNKKRREGPSKIKMLWYFWRGRVVTYDNEGNSRIMQDFTAWLFSFFAWVLLIATFLFVGATIYVGIAMINWSAEKMFGNIAGLFFISVLVVFCFAISFILKVMSHDIKREKDRHYVLALFSGMVSFVAMIISLIALFK